MIELHKTLTFLHPFGFTILMPIKLLLKNLAHLSGCQEPVDVFGSFNSITIFCLKFGSKCLRC